MNRLGARDERVLALHVVGIGHAAIDRAHRGAGFVVVKPDAFGAEQRVDDVELLALADRVVGAFGLACPAVDALACDHRRHSCEDSEFVDYLLVSARVVNNFIDLRRLKAAEKLCYRETEGGVPKWLRERSAKPRCSGSNPLAASNFFPQTITPFPLRRPDGRVRRIVPSRKARRSRRSSDRR